MKTKMWAVVVMALLGAVAYGQVYEEAKTRAPVWFKDGIYLGTEAPVAGNRLKRMLGNSGTVDFASTSVGRVESSGITVTGAKAGDPCFVGVPTAAGALAATYSCYVSATNTVKIVFTPLSQQRGVAQLDGGSPAQIDVTGITASSNCTCAPIGATAAIAAAGCAVSLTSTTLTITGPNTVGTNVNYDCVAPVDPASGTYYVRIVSSQL